MKLAEWKRMMLGACVVMLALPAVAQQLRPEQRGQPGMMPPQPEMAKKVTKVAALREMHRLGMTAEDVEKALSHVRALRDAETRLRTRSEQLLDQEIQALLAARPDDPPLPDSGDAMRRLAEEYRQTENQTWEALSGAIGPLKADALRRLVSGPDRRPEGGRPDFVRPGGAGPRPGEGADGFGPPEQDMVAPPPGVVPQLGEASRQPQGAPPQGQRMTPAGPGGQGPGFPPQPGSQFVPLMQPRITLAELAELLEQKLAAMRKSR